MTPETQQESGGVTNVNCVTTNVTDRGGDKWPPHFVTLKRKENEMHHNLRILLYTQLIFWTLIACTIYAFHFSPAAQ